MGYGIEKLQINNTSMQSIMEIEVDQLREAKFIRTLSKTGEPKGLGCPKIKFQKKNDFLRKTNTPRMARNMP